MYAKLMSRITESSLMDEDIPVRYCFVMLLAIADPQGYVVGTDIAIARRLNMPLEDFKHCVAQLMQPDEDSNSKEEEGRRVIESDCERGYFLVNYRKYRDTRDEEQRREWMRNYMRNYRAGKDVAHVNSCKQRKPPLAKEEGEEKEEVNKGARKARCTREELISFCLEIGLQSIDGESMFEHWEGNGWKNGSNTVKDWKSTVRKWKLHGWHPSQKQQPQKASHPSQGIISAQEARERQAAMDAEQERKANAH